MKPTKPEDEKFFKDIVLNSILEEISNEQGKTLKGVPQKPTKRIKIRPLWFLIPAAFFTLLITLIIYMDQAVITPAPATPVTTPKKEVIATKQQTPIAKPVQRDETHITLTFESEENPDTLSQENQRQNAKAELLKQMKN